MLHNISGITTTTVAQPKPTRNQANKHYEQTDQLIMGGDGGVIASNRRYMRGAGTADHTADSTRSRGEKQVSDREDALERMRTCALTKAPLQFGEQAIVVCPYGRLYHKEAAVEALLRRKQSSDELGSHIRGLKDLHEARFHLTKKANGSQIPSCPVTGQEFNGRHPVILLVPGKKETANVVSQRAFKEMGREALETEYGPFQDEIRLAPPASELGEIMEVLEAKRKKKEKSKKSSKKDKKRKEISDGNNKKPKQNRPKVAKVGLADVARGRVQDAVKSNEVLSSLFTTQDRKVTDKERNDNLFAR